MAVAIVTHKKVSVLPDGNNSDLIRPSDWNDTHVVKTYEHVTDIPPVNPSPYDDEFDDGVIAPEWSVSNSFVGTTIKEEKGALWLRTIGPTTSGTHRFNGVYRSIPTSGTRELFVKFKRMTPMSDYNGPVLIIRNAANGFNTAIGILGHRAHGNGRLFIMNQNPDGTLVSEVSTESFFFDSTIYLKVALEASQYKIYVSPDGTDFSIPSWIGTYWPNIGSTGSAVDQAGVGVLSTTMAATGHATKVEWFRVGVDGVYHG